MASCRAEVFFLFFLFFGFFFFFFSSVFLFCVGGVPLGKGSRFVWLLCFPSSSWCTQCAAGFVKGSVGMRGSSPRPAREVEPVRG